ncbi:MAG: AAA family ATPase [Paludibacteraceae bacterium]|nr:AAA family ATPase [Paludibacteraceae bacterium]
MSEKKLKLTPHQQCALDKLLEFTRQKDKRVFVLKGYAGTGKTTMTKVLIEKLSKRNYPYVLLASTGRAAKILANKTGAGTSTVHGLIYKFKDLSQDMDKLVSDMEKNGVDDKGNVYLNFEPVTNDSDEEIYYLVDEASMVSDKEDLCATQALFGSGRLLSDLLSYHKKGKFIFIGDACQLPPVTQKISPALSVDYFKQEFDVEADEFELTEVVRQKKGNDIVESAQKMRQLYVNPQTWKWAKFPFRNYKNIHIVESQAALIDMYIKRAKKVGYKNATLLGLSNKQCDTLTNILRPAFGICSERVTEGDLLLVTQNNFVSGLMNGDIVVVKEVRTPEYRAGLHFLPVTVEELETKLTYSQLMVEEILYNNQTNLTQTQQKDLFVDFYKRMKELKIKQNSLEFNDMMLKDPYLNALRTVYGYALTCHKAQGGEWEHVYLDIPRHLPGIEKPYVYQWIYTAMTRASKELYVVNDFWIM